MQMQLLGQSQACRLCTSNYFDIPLEGIRHSLSRYTSFAKELADHKTILEADLLAFRRSLGVNARAKSEAHVAHKKTAIAKQIEDDAFLNCDLIAKPIY